MQRTDITALFPEATKEQIDKLMDINGADINKAKGDADGLRSSLSAAQTELAALKAKPDDDDLARQLKIVSDELAGLKQANALRDIREKVAKATGVPASLLTAETEDACKAQAEAINAYAKPGGYPQVKDGGEVHTTGPSATRDKFADWFDNNFPASNS